MSDIQEPISDRNMPYFHDRSQNTASLAAALAAAQKAFGPIPKDREVTVITQTGGTYKFKYATLDGICKATMPALSAQGLAISQALTEWGDHYAVKTTLYHSSGEWISNMTPMFVSGRRTKDGRELPPGNQELGSAQSYARRYGLSALLCVTADEDDDGNTADGNHAEPYERTPYKPSRPAMRQPSSAAGRKMAQDDPHLLDDTRPKGTVAKPVPTTAAEKAKDWVDKAITTLNLADNTKEALNAFWKENREKIEYMETNVPAQHERLMIAFDNAMEAAARHG